MLRIDRPPFGESGAVIPIPLQWCSKSLSPSKIWFADSKLLVLQSILSDGSMFLRTAVEGDGKLLRHLI